MKEFQPSRRLSGIRKSAIRDLFDRARPDSINLGLGEPDVLTPEVIRREAARIALEEQNGYTTHAGLVKLRQHVVDDYRHFINSTDQVCITSGSQEAMYLALMTIVDEGDEVLIPNPGFVAYPTIVKMAGGVPVFYRLPASSGFSFDAEEFRSRITPRTKAVICISPSNPTGRVLSRDDLAAMGNTLGETGIYAISDEIYRDLYFTKERPASLSEYYDRCIVIGGLSKSMSMTGWRLGWICGDEAVVRSALVLHGYVTTCAPAISQKSALLAWTDEAKVARNEIRSIFHERRDFLVKLIEEQLGLRCVVPDGAFYTMVDVSAYGDSVTVAEGFLEHGVTTVPGSAFGSEAEGYLRLSFCADSPALAEGVNRIQKALKEIARRP